MNRVIHFEVPVDNPECAVKFYADVFDWKIDKWTGPVDYWLATTGSDDPGIDGALTRRSEVVSAPVVTINVASVDESLKEDSHRRW